MSVHDTSDTNRRLIAATKVNGTNVYNPAGEKLGSVYDVMIAKDTGKAEYAVMSFGGFLGIGEQYHPLPWRVLSYSPDMGGFVVNIDINRLKGGPVYSREMSPWNDPVYGQRIDDYYGTGAL